MGYHFQLIKSKHDFAAYMYERKDAEETTHPSSLTLALLKLYKLYLLSAM